MAIAIHVEGLGKFYKLGEQPGGATLAETIIDRLGRRQRRIRAPQREVIWALRDVSFDVGEGEVLGIVGANGAGKSTTLKILSRITEPSEGGFKVWGRVASLLEVGTGFHGQLTGRENVFLNGSLLGMSRREIERSFDEIVEFAGVGPAIDTPVKRYSTGMHLRLAFAVAAHLLPEVLIIDEVLAVGDAAFVRKCIGRLDEIAQTGRTVVFVSHNMGTVRRLCTTALLLEAGRLAFHGPPQDVTNFYLDRSPPDDLGWERSPDLWRSEIGGFSQTRLGGGLGSRVVTSAPLVVTVRLEVLIAHPDLRVTLRLLDGSGDPVLSTHPGDSGIDLPSAPGSYLVRAELPVGLLLPRPYGISLELWSPSEGCIDRVDELRFEVEDAGISSDDPTGDRVGVVHVPGVWSCDQIPNLN